MSPFPLQVPGAPELLIVVAILAVAFGLVGRWVYRDAKSRGATGPGSGESVSDFCSCSA